MHLYPSNIIGEGNRGTMSIAPYKTSKKFKLLNTVKNIKF